MPVFWFALSFVDDINITNTLLIFFILHFLVYPASNGYNSYMDRDESSIGGIKKPPLPTMQLYHATILLDILAVVSSFMVSWWFAICISIYIICSRLYSYRGVRLKKYAVGGYLTVIINQGALTFYMVYQGAQALPTAEVPWYGLVAAAFLIGGFYPITQVYQHEADAKDGVLTISMLLGKRGTFIFCALMYAIAFAILFLYFLNNNLVERFYVLQLFFIPVITLFVWWFLQVLKNETAASFKHTMRMNWLASTCTSLAFITLILLQYFG